ncbi:MAG TPA: methylmalonyl Co-A mutase-associated GTPase MeaB [Anaerolineales bacterium]
MSEMDLASLVLAGDRLALSRTLSRVENGTAEGMSALNALFAHTGKAHLVGITGASGTGKSSLVNQLALYYRQPAKRSEPAERSGPAKQGGPAKRSEPSEQSGSAKSSEPAQAVPEPRVAIVAVDPTSPFTGGAILGDRIRMRDLAGDPGVFIRSMATRGSLGGIAAATGAVVQVLDAAGFELILIETVGAGQSEVDIARLAHTTIVVEAPGLGDDIQAIKAGILEIADILVVNKADLPGAENTERALRGSLGLAQPPRLASQSIRRVVHHGQLVSSLEPQPALEPSNQAWSPPILRTVALDGTGVAELAEAIAAHRAYLESTGGWGRRERGRLQTELDLLLQSRLVKDFHSHLSQGEYAMALQGVLERRISPFQAVEQLVDKHEHGS